MIFLGGAAQVLGLLCSACKPRFENHPRAPSFSFLPLSRSLFYVLRRGKKEEKIGTTDQQGDPTCLKLLSCVVMRGVGIVLPLVYNDEEGLLNCRVQPGEEGGKRAVLETKQKRCCSCVVCCPHLTLKGTDGHACLPGKYHSLDNLQI